MMAQKAKSCHNFFHYKWKPVLNNIQFVYGGNSQPDQARELFKPSKDS